MNTIFVEHRFTHRSGSLPEFLLRLKRKLGQLTCGVSGHDMLMHYEHKRLSLVCASCGYESPGWSVSGSPVRTVPPARDSTTSRPQPHLTLTNRRAA